MGIRTSEYNIKAGQILKIKLPKREAEYFVREALQPIIAIQKYQRELWGMTTDPEPRSTILMDVFGGNHEPKEGFEEVKNEFLAGLPETITKENAQGIKQRSEEIFQKFVHETDKRRTPEQETEQETAREIQSKEFENERNAKKRGFLLKWGKVDEPVTVSPGEMAVTLTLTYDNSDSMTDYSDPHRSVGEDLLLAVIPKQARRESVLRQVVARYPFLSQFSYTWHEENYSFGHGNYLMTTGTVVDIEGEEVYRNGHSQNVNRASLEIEFGYPKNYTPFREYPGIPVEKETNQESRQTVSEVTIQKNEAKGGIEVLFPEKPDRGILIQLKALGLRWSQKQGLWWAKDVPGLFEKIREVTEHV